MSAFHRGGTKLSPDERECLGTLHTLLSVRGLRDGPKSGADRHSQSAIPEQLIRYRPKPGSVGALVEAILADLVSAMKRAAIAWIGRPFPQDLATDRMSHRRR